MVLPEEEGSEKENEPPFKNTKCMLFSSTYKVFLLLAIIGTMRTTMDMFAARFERKTKLKDEELKLRRMEIEFNLNCSHSKDRSSTLSLGPRATDTLNHSSHSVANTSSSESPLEDSFELLESSLAM